MRSLLEPSEKAVRIVLPWGALASSNLRNKRRGGKGHGRAYKASLDAVHLTAMAQLRERGVRLPAFPGGAVAITLRFHPPDRRRRDETNYLKATLDALAGVVYADDSQIVAWTGSRESTDPKRPRVEIEVRTA